MMKCVKKYPWCMFLAVLLTLTLAGCAASGSANNASGAANDGSDTTNDVSEDDASGTVDTQEDSGTAVLMGGSGAVNDGMRLSVPAEYKGLLVIETPQNDADGILFSVSEKESIDTAKALGYEFDGAGWLFSVGKVTEDALHEMLCYDMSGAEVFAKGTDGQYYMYYHPTDVRIVRENDDDISRDMEQWIALNEWAATVPETFLAENAGLTAEKHGNSSLDMYLAQIAYLEGTDYTLSMVSYGPKKPGNVDPMPYLERLMNGVTFEYADDDETPDGEYVVLTFPEDDTRFDFFLADGNYIRMVWNNDDGMLYKAVFTDGTTNAGNVMSEWYNALVAADSGEPLETSGFTGEEFVGEWQDEVSQRAVMSIKKTDETGVYDVLIHWGGSYDSAMQWSMKAVAGAQDEILYYENGVKEEITFIDEGREQELTMQENIIWENGTGYLMFRDGYLTWYDEQQTDAADCRFVKAE